MAEMDCVRIVYGLVKRTVADLPAHNPHVTRFYAAVQEGGASAAIAKLKQNPPAKKMMPFSLHLRVIC